MIAKRYNSPLTRRIRRWSAAAAVVAVTAAASSLLFAQEPSTRPALQQLNDETTSLYDQVEAGMVQVQLPRVNPAGKTGLPRVSAPVQPPATQAAGSSPSSDAGEQQKQDVRNSGINIATPPGVTVTITAQSPNGSMVTVSQSKVEAMPVPPPAGEAGGNPALGARMLRPAGGGPSSVGILLDGQGHVLVPTYMEAPSQADGPLRVVSPTGSLQTAQFIGSDRQTNITVLQLDKPVGTPLRWTGDRPVKGSLALFVSPGDGSGRLAMWSGTTSDFGVVVSIDGHVDGIARFGQFLNGPACKRVAQQLVQFGVVKRASLGILISEIQQDDPLRIQLPALGSRSAMHVDDVIAGSAADKAGLKKDDLVLELAGQPVNDIPSFAAAIAARTGRTDVQILRGTHVLTVTADLEPK